MTLANLVSVQEKTDTQGVYTEYVYADGRIETDPRGRPLSLTDLLIAQVGDQGQNALALTPELAAPVHAVAKAAQLAGLPREYLDMMYTTIDIPGRGSDSLDAAGIRLTVASTDLEVRVQL